MSNVLVVRGWDAQGGGFFHAPRGDYKHQGIDIVCHANEAVCALQSGKVVRLGQCYKDKYKDRKHLRLIEILSANGDRWRYLYTAPLVDVGDVVERGQIIGSSQGLTTIFEGITQHYHFEIMPPGGWKVPCINPVPILEGLGYVIRSN